MQYISTRQAAEYLGVSRKLLEKLRHRGGGPEFYRVTDYCVRYRLDALDAWMERRRAGTEEEAA